MNLDNFTAAGFQEHQKKSGGYGIISSSEGQRFMAGIFSKISKGEGEISRLKIVWDGDGDETVLRSGTRGYDKTAVSMSLYIQPALLLSEMLHC